MVFRLITGDTQARFRSQLLINLVYHVYSLNKADQFNDPATGSPTATLLRLLLPLKKQVRPPSQPIHPNLYKKGMASSVD
jgi:hypothetical protein